MISTRGRYALRVMIDLAQHDNGEFISLKVVSQRQEVSMKYLEMIVAILNKGGLLQSQRGKDGGYRLIKPADQYTVSEIVNLTEGSLASVPCLDCEENLCARADSCLTLPLWKHLDGMINRYLSSITVQDLIDGKVSD